MKVVDDYVEKLQIENLERRVFQPDSATPLIVYRLVPEHYTQNVMVYGHLDKQPYDEPWDEGLHPTEPVIRGSRLYGRGAYDDGFAVFSALLAIKAIQKNGGKMPRICVVLETEEESGSDCLVDLLKESKEYVGEADFMFCLDSGCLDYERLWITSSLRGVIEVDIEVQAAENSYHSGEVGGIVPETFRVLRAILDKVDDALTGQVVESLQSPIPNWKLEEAKDLAESQGKQLYDKYPVHEGVKYLGQEDLV